MLVGVPMGVKKDEHAAIMTVITNGLKFACMRNGNKAGEIKTRSATSRRRFCHSGGEDTQQGAQHGRCRHASTCGWLKSSYKVSQCMRPYGIHARAL